MKLTIKIVIGAMLVLWGTWLALPRRSHFFEDLESSCRLGSGTLIRFFIGDGGATTALSYSITVQPGAPWTESEVFHANREPDITGMLCHGDTASVSSAGQTWVLESRLLEQKVSPAEYWRGRDMLISPNGELLPLDKLRIIFGIGVLLGGAFVVLRTVKQRRAAEQAVAADGATPRR